MGTHRTALALVLAVVALTFGLGARRRSVRSAPCIAPGLVLTVSPKVACPAEAVTLTWRASDKSAVVSIEGIGNALAANGSSRVTSGRRFFKGFATSTCGRGNEASVTVDTPAAPTASISGPSSMREGDRATLFFTVSGDAQWVASSSLGNAIFPASGFGSDTATYTASNPGVDGVLLQCSGKCGFTVSQSATVIVDRTQTPPPPPPPPPSGTLRCCDGTRSPTCTSCANKRGCCSGHGGVCGC